MDDWHFKVKRPSPEEIERRRGKIEMLCEHYAPDGESTGFFVHRRQILMMPNNIFHATSVCDSKVLSNEEFITLREGLIATYLRFRKQRDG